MNVNAVGANFFLQRFSKPHHCKFWCTVNARIGIAVHCRLRSEIDYVEELGGSYLNISNPMMTSSCGCGASFSVWREQAVHWCKNSKNRFSYDPKELVKQYKDIRKRLHSGAWYQKSQTCLQYSPQCHDKWTEGCGSIKRAEGRTEKDFHILNLIY